MVEVKPKRKFVDELDVYIKNGGEPQDMSPSQKQYFVKNITTLARKGFASHVMAEEYKRVTKFDYGAM